MAVSVELSAPEARQRPAVSTPPEPAGATAGAAGRKPCPEHPVFPSLDTSGSSCTHPPDRAGVDPEWMEKIRAGVAAELEREWPKRADALRDCGRAAVKLKCEGCGELTLLPFRCEARTCPYCARVGAAAVADRIGARVVVHDEVVKAEPWEGPGGRQRRSWRHLTLTSWAPESEAERFDPAELRRRVRAVRDSFRPFWRSLAWGRQARDPGSRSKRARRDTSYVFALEVSPRGMVHVHALIYGEYIPQAELQGAWSRAVGRRSIVDVRTVSGPAGVASALREVIKYATKGEAAPREQARRAAAVELAMRNLTRITIGGALRKVKIEREDGAAEDVRPEDVHDRAEACCEDCGLIGEWKWIGIDPAAIVEKNGGFGLLRSPPGRTRQPRPPP